MAKLSGFFMSTLLIVLCLWINVCHYPDAPRAATSNDANEAPVDAVPSAAPASQPVEEETNEQDSANARGLLAQSDVAPALLDVSADSAATSPVLEPALFPGDGAEIDDAALPQTADAPQPSLLNEKISPDVPQVAPAPSPTPQTASPAVATPTQDARRLETKPRGAKYVRVPEVEIDAFSGGVRVSRSSNDEVRVVGAARAGQVKRVAPPAP